MTSETVDPRHPNVFGPAPLFAPPPVRLVSPTEDDYDPLAALDPALLAADHTGVLRSARFRTNAYNRAVLLDDDDAAGMDGDVGGDPPPSALDQPHRRAVAAAMEDDEDELDDDSSRAGGYRPVVVPRGASQSTQQQSLLDVAGQLPVSFSRFGLAPPYLSGTSLVLLNWELNPSRHVGRDLFS